MHTKDGGVNQGVSRVDMNEGACLETQMDGLSEDDARWKRVDRPLTLLPWWLCAAGALRGGAADWRWVRWSWARGVLLGWAAERSLAAARWLQQLDGCSWMAAAGGFAAAGFGGCSGVNQLGMDSSDGAPTAYIVVEKRRATFQS